MYLCRIVTTMNMTSLPYDWSVIRLAFSRSSVSPSSHDYTDSQADSALSTALRQQAVSIIVCIGLERD